MRVLLLICIGIIFIEASRARPKPSMDFGALLNITKAMDAKAHVRSSLPGPEDFPRVGDVVILVGDVSCVISNVLGTGTNSKVFEGECGPTKYGVALKYQFSESSSEDVSLVQKDWDFLSLMQGTTGFPKVFHISPVGKYRGSRYPFQYVVMEKVGVSLRQYAGQGLSAQELIPLILQVVSRLEAIHRKGFYFGDVHLENIMVKSSTAYLLDFGRAGAFMYSDGSLVPNERVVLSPSKNIRYLSPAELNNGRLSRRDDIFRLAEVAVRACADTQASYSSFVRENARTQSGLAEAKLTAPLREILRGLHPNLQSFYDYARELKYEDAPDYEHIRSILKL